MQRNGDGRIGRIAAAIVVVVGSVVAISVLAGSIGRAADDDRGLGVGDAVSGEALDALVVALLTLGLALTIAVFIVQFGGEAEEAEKPSTIRRVIGAVATAVLLVGTLALVRQLDLSASFDATFEDQAEQGDGGGGQGGSGGLGLEATEQEDRSPVGTWTGLAFGLLLIAVVFFWMWAERQRRAVEARAGESAEERDTLADLLDLAIDDLRDDPDPRRAVIKAWGRLGDAFASVGLPRDEAEAPYPYLERVLSAVDTSGPAARRLTEAFERAMFSPHAIDARLQSDAVDALIAVRDELRATTPR